MKVLKNFLIIIITVLLMICLMAIGIVFNLKYTITDTVGEIVKDEISNNIVDTIAKNSEMNKEEIKVEIDKVLNDNPTIKKTVDDCFNKAIDILNGKDVKELNIRNEVEKIINDNEATLKEYGVTITDEEKTKILDYVSSEEFNNEFNSAIIELKEEIPSMALKVFTFSISTTFKIILIGLVILFIIIIALLKKSTYKWMPNFATASLITGILYSISFIFIEEILKENENIQISFEPLKLYGFIMIGVGVLFIILNLIIKKINKPLKNNE